MDEYMKDAKKVPISNRSLISCIICAMDVPACQSELDELDELERPLRFNAPINASMAVDAMKLAAIMELRKVCITRISKPGRLSIVATHWVRMVA